MIGSAANDRVDAFFLVEHFAEIFVTFGLGISLESFGGVIPIDVGERDDVFVFDGFDVPSALSADANSGDVKLAVGRRTASTENVRFDDHERGRGCGCADERATGNGSVCFHKFSIFEDKVIKLKRRRGHKIRSHPDVGAKKKREDE
jgi:hypothetical protein